MTETATGLVLRTRPLTDTSLIVHWLTPTCGRLATVAKGARRQKSPFRGKLDLFYLAEFSYQRSQRSDLHQLREVSLRETFPFLRTDLSYLRQVCYCAELIEQSTESETPLPEVFELFHQFLGILPAQPAQPHLVFAFELRLLSEMGLQPDLGALRLTAGARELVNRFAQIDWEMVGRLRLSAAQTREIGQFLHNFLLYHLERVPKGRESALTPEAFPHPTA
jgi:DNA repair protein RecO (recombination protein O)